MPRYGASPEAKEKYRPLPKGKVLREILAEIGKKKFGIAAGLALIVGSFVLLFVAGFTYVTVFPFLLLLLSGILVCLTIGINLWVMYEDHWNVGLQSGSREDIDRWDAEVESNW